MGSKSLIRSRWAAIGAAVAVTLGGGGLIGVSAASGDASSLKTTTPTRIMDTRQGSDGKVSGETVALQVTGEITTYASNGTTPAATVVPAGANAVAVNLTVTQGERNQGYGFVTAFPCAADSDTVPNASTLNFVEGTDVANSTVVPLGATGKMCLNVYGSAHVIVDVSGYYETAAAGAAAVDAYTKAESDVRKAALESNLDDQERRLDGLDADVASKADADKPLGEFQVVSYHPMSGGLDNGSDCNPVDDQRGFEIHIDDQNYGLTDTCDYFLPLLPPSGVNRLDPTYQDAEPATNEYQWFVSSVEICWNTIGSDPIISDGIFLRIFGANSDGSEAVADNELSLNRKQIRIGIPGLTSDLYSFPINPVANELPDSASPDCGTLYPEGFPLIPTISVGEAQYEEQLGARTFALLWELNENTSSATHSRIEIHSVSVTWNFLNINDVLDDL